MLPSASAAAALRLASRRIPWSRISASATSCADSGAEPQPRTARADGRQQRSPASDDTSRKIDAEGGSSSVLSSALCAGGCIASASSMMTTPAPASNGRNPARSMHSRTGSILIEPVSPGSMTIDVRMHAALDAAAGRAGAAGIARSGAAFAL